MMWWYRATYGSWRNPDGVHFVQYGDHEWQTGTYDRKEAFAKAQQVANEKNVVVTVSQERGNGCGIVTHFHEVRPET